MKEIGKMIAYVLFVYIPNSSQRSGWGVFSTPDGTKYEGDWENNKKDGKGTLFFASGDAYQGIWKDGLPVSGTYSFHPDSLWANPDL
jgi:hypothetical protein